MNHQTISIRPFIGAKDFDVSRRFYRDLGFKETILSPQMSLFSAGHTDFYLQHAYVKDWIDNTMVFLEVDDADRYYAELLATGVTTRYEGVRLVPVRHHDWGKECFLHDPSGVLWHFGQFNS